MMIFITINFEMILFWLENMVEILTKFIIAFIRQKSALNHRLSTYVGSMLECKWNIQFKSSMEINCFGHQKQKKGKKQ